MKNRYIIDDRICWIELTKSQWTQIDIEDMDLVKDYRWLSSHSRAISNSNKKITKSTTYLHRLILNTPKRLEADHINHNPLDNRRINLRNVTHLNNLLNRRSFKNSSSSYLGVSFNSSLKKWESYITINQKLAHIGYFESEKEAAIVRASAFVKEYGIYTNPEQTRLSTLAYITPKNP